MIESVIMRFVLLTLLCLCGLTMAGDRIIVIDAGHGGSKPSGTQAERTLSSDNNAVSPGGLKEKDLTLELAQQIIAKVNAKKAGVKAVPTRTADVNPDFARRAAVAAETKAEWFLSIHFNAVPKGAKKKSGTLGLVQMKSKNPHYPADAAFAAALTSAANGAIRQWLPQSPALPVMDDRGLHGGQGSNLFYQLRRQTKQPLTACFLEVEFMDNPAVEAALLTKNRAAAFEAVAEALAVAIVQAAAAAPRP
jgi:N-acetylmuramoyl-L-alanine amidase